MFGHVVGFASRNALQVGFCELCLLHLGSSKAALWLRWCHLGANFGDFGAVLKAIWDHFGPCCFGIVKNNPKIHLQNARLALKAKKNQIKNRPKTQNFAKTQTCMAVKAKRNQKSLQNPPSKCSPQWPCSLNLFPGRQNKGPP